MALRTLPGIALSGFWDLGETYKAGMDGNLQKLSAITQLSVQSKDNALPGTPTLGDIYIVPSGDPTNPNTVAVWEGETGSEAWVYFTPREGWLAYVQDLGRYHRFDGTSWAELTAASDGNAGFAFNLISLSADFNLSETHLSGGAYLDVDTTAANVTVTIPTGLTGTEPVSLENTGTNSLVFVAAAGVTIQSRDSELTAPNQYQAVTIIPKQSDVYSLIGVVSTA